MTRKPLKVALTAVAFGSCLVVCKAQSNVPASGRTYNIDGTRIKVLIPPEMSVAMTPQHLEANLGSATLSYKFKLPVKEPTRMLRWNFYVSDSGGKLIDKNSWNDVGDWKPGSEVEETAFIIYDSKPGTKLTIVLGEVVNDAGVRRIDEEDMEQKLERILAGKAMLPAPRFIAHADVSDADGEELFKRSLNFILTKEPFRKDLKLPLPALLLSDDPNAAPPLPDVQLISEEFVKEKLRVGESIKYLKYTGFGSHGNEVTVSILYYTPRVLRNGAGYIGRGLVINFTYVKQQSRYKLKRVDTIGLDY